MTTSERIAAARATYLESPRSRRDWMDYLNTVEPLEALEHAAAVLHAGRPPGY